MWNKHGEPKLCGLKTADGAACVLDFGHDPEKSWETREHKTADGSVFTWSTGQGADEMRFMNRLPFGTSGQI